MRSCYTPLPLSLMEQPFIFINVITVSLRLVGANSARHGLWASQTNWRKLMAAGEYTSWKWLTCTNENFTQVRIATWLMTPSVLDFMARGENLTAPARISRTYMAPDSVRQRLFLPVPQCVSSHVAWAEYVDVTAGLLQSVPMAGVMSRLWVLKQLKSAHPELKLPPPVLLTPGRGTALYTQAILLLRKSIRAPFVHACFYLWYADARQLLCFLIACLQSDEILSAEIVRLLQVLVRVAPKSMLYAIFAAVTCLDAVAPFAMLLPHVPGTEATATALRHLVNVTGALQCHRHMLDSEKL